MGYTHYYRQQRHATPAEWDAIAKGFAHLQTAALLTKAFPIQLNDDDTGPAEITPNSIIFNGIGDDGHETMILVRCADGFQFCKTARKPYDRAVVALLILAHHYAPDVWNISSDGETEDWQPTLDWMNDLGVGDFKLPLEVRSDVY